LEKLAGEAPVGSAVLDFGCGNGRLLDLFRAKIKYLGIDQSGKLVEKARENFAGKVWKNPPSGTEAEFAAGDILAPEKIGVLKEKKFDRIFCIAVIHQLPGDEARIAALKNMKMLLNPGGRIVVSVWNLWRRPEKLALIFKFALLKIIGLNRTDFGDIVFDWKGKEKLKRYYHAFSRHGFERLATAAGLKVEETIKDKFNYYFVLRNNG